MLGQTKLCAVVHCSMYHFLIYFISISVFFSTSILLSMYIVYLFILLVLFLRSKLPATILYIRIVVVPNSVTIKYIKLGFFYIDSRGKYRKSALPIVFLIGDSGWFCITGTVFGAHLLFKRLCSENCNIDINQITFVLIKYLSKVCHPFM